MTRPAIIKDWRITMKFIQLILLLISFPCTALDFGNLTIQQHVILGCAVSSVSADISGSVGAESPKLIGAIVGTLASSYEAWYSGEFGESHTEKIRNGEAVIFGAIGCMTLEKGVQLIFRPNFATLNFTF